MNWIIQSQQKWKLIKIVVNCKYNIYKTCGKSFWSMYVIHLSVISHATEPQDERDSLKRKSICPVSTLNICKVGLVGLGLK